MDFIPLDLFESGQEKAKFAFWGVDGEATTLNLEKEKSNSPLTYSVQFSLQLAVM